MAENITVLQALAKLEQISREWVNNDLDKGIPLPFRYWRNGYRKERISKVLWQNPIVPLTFTVLVIALAINKIWVLFVLSLLCYVFYWCSAVWIRRRESANFILKSDGLTIVTPQDKTFFPWDAIEAINSTADEWQKIGNHQDSNDEQAVYSNRYCLEIHAGKRVYVFYEVYAKSMVMDSDNVVNPAMMQLHIAYKMLKAAQHKVNKK